MHVCISWSCRHVMVVHRPCQHENVRINIHIRHIHAFPSKPFPITPFAKLKPHWSHKRHFVVATRPTNGKPRNHHRGIVGTYTFWYLDTPISYTSWNGSNMIEYDRIAFRSFCPLSLNWWMNFPKLLRYKRTIYMGTVPGCRSYEAFQYIHSPAITSLLNCFTLWWLIALRCPDIFICIHLIYIYMHVYIIYWRNHALHSQGRLNTSIKAPPQRRRQCCYASNFSLANLGVSPKINREPLQIL